jgi:hypothetical protein
MAVFRDVDDTNKLKVFIWLRHEKNGDEIREEGAGAPRDDLSLEGPRHRVPDVAPSSIS